jgi:hypothetical protein
MFCTWFLGNITSFIPRTVHYERVAMPIDMQWEIKYIHICINDAPLINIQLFEIIIFTI